MTSAPAIADKADSYSVSVDKIDAAEWNQLLEGFEDASIYQSWSYAAAHWPPRQVSHLTLERDGRVVSMAQLRVIQAPAIRAGIAYIRWGPLCRLKGEPFDPRVVQTALRALRDEYVVRRGLVLRMLPPVFVSDPEVAACDSAWQSMGLKKKGSLRDYRTIRLDLRPALEDLRRGLGAKWRNKLNGAEKNGLSISEGTTIEDFDRFLGAYAEMMSRKQFETSVDVAEFRAMQIELPEPLRMRVFLCEKDGRLANALIVSRIGDTAIYLLGATSDEGLKLKGAYLLQWRAIQWLKEQGCRWYDLGGINPEGNPGVYEFKSGFGGEDVSQVGTFEAAGNWMSNLALAAAARASSWKARLKRAKAKGGD